MRNRIFKCISLCICCVLILSMYITYVEPLSVRAIDGEESLIQEDGLDIWLTADQGVVLDDNGNVSSWTSIADGEDVTVVQSTESSRPELIDTDTRNTYISFDGVDDYLEDSDFVNYNGETEMTIITLTQSTLSTDENGGNFYTLVHVPEDGGWGALFFSPYTDRFIGRFGTGSSSTGLTYWFTDDEAETVSEGLVMTAAVKDGSEESVYLNGEKVLVETGRSTTLANLDKLLYIGKGIPSGGYYGGDVAEIIIYDRALSDAEILEVQEYFNNKYFGGDKEASDVSVSGVPSDSIQYGDQIDVEVLVDELGEGEGTYYWKVNGDGEVNVIQDVTDSNKAIIQATGVGEVNITVQYESDTHIGSQTFTLDINPIEVSILSAVAEDREYEAGDTEVTIATIVFDGVPDGIELLNSEDYLVSKGYMSDDSVGTNKTVSSVTVTMSNDNFTIAGSTSIASTVNIVQGIYPSGVRGTGSAKYGATGSYSIARWMTIDDAVATVKSVNDTDKILDGDVEIIDNALSFTMKDDVDNIGKSAEVVINVASKNYQDFEVTVSLIVTETDEPLVVTEVYVATDGSDDNNGTYDAPFATIQAARDYVRTLDMLDDISVIMKEGTYYLEEEIDLTPEDSGKNGFTVTYTSEEGADVHIVGGVPVTDWTDSNGDGIYEADVSENNDFWALYDNNESMQLAKESNWSSMTFNDDRIQVVWTGGWFGEVIRAESVVGSTITYPEGVSTSKWVSSILFLQGAKEFINEAGEWAIEGDTLYYKPVSGTVEDRTIIRATVDKVFDIQGDDEDTRVSNIIIENLTIEMNDAGENLIAQSGYYTGVQDGYDSRECDENLQALITIDQANDIIVRNNEIYNGAHVGVSTQHYGQNITIEGNKMEDFGYCAIFLIGDNPGSLNYYNKNNTVTNNYIRNCGGEYLPQGSGIYLINSGDNDITYNDISETNRYAISLKGVRYRRFEQNLMPGPDEVSWDEHFVYNQTQDNYIAFNNISNCGANSSDGGGIESWGMGRDNVIYNNIIVDAYTGSASTGWRGHSIFMDDGSNYVYVENNLTYDTGAPSIDAGIMSKSYGQVFVNNYFITDYAEDGLANLQKWNETCGNNTISRNIIASYADFYVNANGTINTSADAEPVMVRVASMGYTDALDAVVEMDYNIYYSATSEVKFSMPNEMLDLEGWQALENGVDQNSIEADPLFVSREDYDFRLTADSPAFAMGINAIDYSNVGLTSAYMFADSSDELEYIYADGIDDQQVYEILEVDDTYQLYVSGRTVDGYYLEVEEIEQLTFTSDNEDAATVDSDGLITVVGGGRADVTVSGTYNGVEKTAVFTIFSDEEPMITAEDITLPMLSSEKISVTVASENGLMYQDVTYGYASDNPEVATVSSTGTVTGVSMGTANITVTAQVGDSIELLKTTITVTVEDMETMSMYTQVDGDDAHLLYGLTSTDGVIGNSHAGDYFAYYHVDFGDTGAQYITVSTATATTPGTLEVRLGSSTGTLVGTITVPTGSSWDAFVTTTVELDEVITGVQDVYFVYTGTANVEWLKFTELGMNPDAKNLFVETLASESDDSNGIQTENSGANIGYVDYGDYFAYYDVDFGNDKAEYVMANISSDKGSLDEIGYIEVRLDSKDGTVIAVIDGLITGSWTSYQVSAGQLTEEVSGVHDLYFVFSGAAEKSSMNVQWVQLAESTNIMPETIEIAGPELVNIDMDNTQTFSYQAEAYNELGILLDDTTLIYALDQEYEGITIDSETGVLTVDKDAEPVDGIIVSATFATTMLTSYMEVEVFDGTIISINGSGADQLADTLEIKDSGDYSYIDSITLNTWLMYESLNLDENLAYIGVTYANSSNDGATYITVSQGEELGDNEIAEIALPLTGAWTTLGSVKAEVSDTYVSGEDTVYVEFGGQHRFVSLDFYVLNDRDGDDSSDEPGTDVPGTDEPGTDEPGTDDSGTDDSGTDESGTDDSETDDLESDDTVTDESDSDSDSQDASTTEDAADTGDNSNVMPIVVVMLLALAGGIAAFTVKRRNSKIK